MDKLKSKLTMLLVLVMLMSECAFAELPAFFKSNEPIASYRDNDAYLLTIGGQYCDVNRYPVHTAAGLELIELAKMMSRVTKVNLYIDPDCEAWVREHASDSDQLRFHIRPTQSIWVRDFGPFWIRPKEDEPPVIVDLPYFSDRGFYEDTFPSAVSGQMGVGAVLLPTNEYDLQGGNLLVDDEGNCFLTDLNNPEKRQSYSELLRWMGCKKRVFITPIPEELTMHVDLILSIAPNKLAFMAQFVDPRNQSSQQIMEKNYEIMRKLGYTVIPVPHSYPEKPATAVYPGDNLSRGIFKSYVNVIIAGKEVFVPQYDDELDAKVIRIFQKAGFVTHGVSAVNLMRLQGSIHCVVSEQKAI